MTVTMVPGANAALTAENPDLTRVVVALGWDVIESHGPEAELVPLAVLCGDDGRALSNEHMVFFNQIVSHDGSVAFVDDADDEEIDVDLSAVPPEVAKIVFLVYVDPDVRGVWAPSPPSGRPTSGSPPRTVASSCGSRSPRATTGASTR